MAWAESVIILWQPYLLMYCQRTSALCIVLLSLLRVLLPKGTWPGNWLGFCVFALPACPEEKGDERRVFYFPPSTTNSTLSTRSTALFSNNIPIAAVAIVEIKHLIQTSQWLNHSNTVLRPSLLPLKVRSGDVVILYSVNLLPPSSSRDLDMF